MVWGNCIKIQGAAIPRTWKEDANEMVIRRTYKRFAIEDDDLLIMVRRGIL
jgi:hypothetical protein